VKPGTNQITIVGLTPTLDEHSVKVEGTGSAIITDLVVELLPNNEIFDDNEDDDNDEDESDSGDNSDGESETTELKALALEISRLSDRQRTALESMRSADHRLKLLDAYGQSVATRHKGQPQTSIEQCMSFYQAERERIFRDNLAGQVAEREVSTELNKMRKKQDRLRKRAARKAAKSGATKQKERERRRRRRLEKSKENERLRKEREAYWPKKIFVVRITLASNRDGGVTDSKPLASTCDLMLSYVTYHAFWSPAYDLALSTTSDSADLCFDARLANQTSETWEKCKIILSTSQTEFSGLGEPIPTLVPWRVRLSERKGLFRTADILYSREETTRQADRIKQRNACNLRHELFGVERPVLPPSGQKPQVPEALRSINAFGQPVPPQAEGLRSVFGVPGNPATLFGSPSASKSGSPFGSAGRGFAFCSRPEGLLGSVTTRHQAGPLVPFGGSSNLPGTNQAATESGPTNSGGLFGAQPPPPAPAEAPRQQGEDGPDAGDDGATLAELQPDLEFEESTFEETGFTSTYDLPGLKTLRPSSVTSKQRVAYLKYSKVTFSRLVVAKYKRAALLTAKVCNDSQLTLLKGQAGLTLDGSFLGRVTLPRCSVGDSFTLSLGVDPSVQVSYPKPNFKHSSSSLFSLSKENTGLYTRLITLANTRKDAGGELQLTVRDQVPVSEEERLKIELLKPSGLVVDGPSVNTGKSTHSSDDKKPWGQAKAMLKQGGEVEWAVAINPGCSTTLHLQYLCVAPVGTAAINAE